MYVVAVAQQFIRTFFGGIKDLPTNENTYMGKIGSVICFILKPQAGPSVGLNDLEHWTKFGLER